MEPEQLALVDLLKVRLVQAASNKLDFFVSGSLCGGMNGFIGARPPIQIVMLFGGSEHGQG